MENSEFFDVIDSEEKAYWLGFFYADGHLLKNGKQAVFMLGLQDRSHLEKFAWLFGRTVKECSSFHKRADKTYITVRCLLSSKHLCDAIRAKGVPQRKSTAETAAVLDHIPIPLVHHFIRGYFDGDGHIGSVHKTEYRFVLCGTFTFLSAVSKMLANELRVAPRQPSWGSGIYRLAWGGVWQLSKIREWLYKDATVYLERKKARFDQMPDHRGTSRYQGVYWSNHNHKWIARIYVDGKTRHIGCYSDEVEAARAYDNAARLYYGYRAKTNFVEQVEPDRSSPRCTARTAC